MNTSGSCDTEIGVFRLHSTAWYYQTKLGSSDQEASSWACKNTRIVLMPYCTWKCDPTAIPSGVGISKVSKCHFLQQMSSNWGSHKLLQELTAYLSVFNLFWTQWIMAILSKGCKPDNFEQHNSLKLLLTNIWDVCFNFVECKLNQTLMTFLLYVRQTLMTQMILAISLWVVIFLYPKGFCYSYAWSHSLCEGVTSFCTGLISRKLCR